MSDEKAKLGDKIPMNNTTKLMLGALILIAVGILATYLPWGKSPETAVPTVAQAEATPDEGEWSKEQMVGLTYEELLELRLEGILKELDGAGATKVMVTTSAGEERVLAEEVVECVQGTNETSGSGTTKTTEKQDIERKIVMQDGDTPFIIKENRPEVEGVLVLAEGADDITIKNAIIQAVSSVLDVPVHKIAVYKMAEN